MPAFLSPELRYGITDDIDIALELAHLRNETTGRLKLVAGAGMDANRDKSSDSWSALLAGITLRW